MLRYSLVGFSKDDRQDMKAAYKDVAAASGRALKALLAGDLTQYEKYFEGNGKKNLMKVSSVLKDVDETIRNRKVTFVCVGPSVNRNQHHACGNRAKHRAFEAGEEDMLALVKGTGTRFASKKVPKKDIEVETSDGKLEKITVRQAWELLWLPSEALTVHVVPSNHDGTRKQLAETLYHELTHAVANTDDLTYDPASCLSLAKQGGASSNAENYCLFISHYLP